MKVEKELSFLFSIQHRVKSGNLSWTVVFTMQYLSFSSDDDPNFLGSLTPSLTLSSCALERISCISSSGMNILL